MSFESTLTREFVEGAAATIAAALILTFITKIFSALVQLVDTAHDFDVRGYWVGSCWLPSYGEDRTVEIWRYARFGSQVRITFYCYDFEDEPPRKWLGRGALRNNMLCAHYYQPTRLNYESGVLALRVKQLRLRGIYAQFDVKKDDNDLYVGHEYEQIRAPLPWIAKLRMTLGFAPYKTRRQARALFELAESRPPS